MGNSKNANEGGIGGSLKNSLSKFTGRVTLKAPPAEELAKTGSKKQATKPKPASPKPMSAPQAEKTVSKPAAAPRTPAPHETKKPSPSPTTQAATPASTPRPAPEQTAATGNSANKLAHDVTVDGKLVFKDRLIFDGRLKGEIQSEGALAIQNQAVVEATIKVKSLLVEGKVVGNIVATDSVRLGATAVVIGDIQTASLTVEPNATFQGQGIIGKTAQAAQTATPTSQKTQSPKQEPQLSLNDKVSGKMPAPGKESPAPQQKSMAS